MAFWRRTLLWGIWALVALFLALVAQMPPAWLFAQWQQDTPPIPVDLGQWQGSVWQGRAQVYYQQTHLGQIAWQLHPQALWQDHPWISAQWTGLGAEAHLQLHHFNAPHTLEFTQVSWNLSGLKALPTLAWMEDLAGKLDTKNLQFQLAPQSVQNPQNAAEVHQAWWFTAAQGQLLLEDLTFMGEKIRQLRINPSMEQQDLLWQLSAQEGAWNLSAKLNLQFQGTYRWQGQIQGATPKDLPGWAALLAPPRGNRVVFGQSGRLFNSAHSNLQ